MRKTLTSTLPASTIIGRAIAAIRNRLQASRQFSRDRRLLAQMNARDLRDIGLDRIASADRYIRR